MSTRKQASCAAPRTRRKRFAAGWSRAAIGVLVLGCLAVPAAATLAAASLAVTQPMGLDYAEPVVYGQAMRIVSGQALYQPIDRPPFTVAAYTPLYYWLAAALQVGVGAGFGPGRLLSLVAGAATAVMLGATAGRRNGGVWVGACAGLLFLALGFPGQFPWLGLYRVDLVGVALSVAAVALLTRSTGTRAILAAGVLAGLAVLCKQTFIAAWIAGTLWQWRDWRRAGAFFGSALLTFAIPCALLEVTTDGAFLQNTVVANVNPFHPSIAAGLLPMFLETQWLPLLLALVYLAVQRPWQTGDSRLLVLYWGLSSLSLLGIAKVGAGTNYWIEFAAATAILAARGAAWVANTSRSVVAAAGAVGVILAIGTSVGGPDGLRATARTIRSDIATVRGSSTNVEFDALLARVRHEPGAVLAEPMDVLVLAGRPVLLEPFVYNLLLDAGRWSPDSLVARICNGEIGLLVLGYPVEVGARMTDGLYALWPAPVMTALQNSMTLDGVQATRYVYTPRRLPAPGVACHIQ
jgi:hypothetical protein